MILVWGIVRLCCIFVWVVWSRFCFWVCVFVYGGIGCRCVWVVWCIDCVVGRFGGGVCGFCKWCWLLFFLVCFWGGCFWGLGLYWSYVWFWSCGLICVCMLRRFVWLGCVVLWWVWCWVGFWWFVLLWRDGICSMCRFWRV